MLSENKRAIDLGLSAIRLGVKSKAPVNKNWPELPFQTYEDLQAKWKEGSNIGLRLGKFSKLVNDEYVYVLDIDFDTDEKRAHEECFSVLDEMLPEWETHAAVRSGSGGPSLHIYLTTTAVLPSRKIARSKNKVEVNGKFKHEWQIDFYGTGKQVVLPPSIHPDTGREYRWLKELDWSRIEKGLPSAYCVKPEIIEAWGERERPDKKSRDPEDAFDKSMQQGPLGLSYDEAKADLKLIPVDDAVDYHSWIEIGQIIHHEFEGSDDGLDLWHWFSDVDGADYDPDALDAKWESFHSEEKSNPKTWRSIKERVNPVKKERAVKELAEEAGDDEEPDKNSWRHHLALDADGHVKASPGNLKLILENDKRLAGLIGFNELRQMQVLRRDMPQLVPTMAAIPCRDTVNGVPWTGSCDNALAMFFEFRRKKTGDGGYGMAIVDNKLARATDQAAKANSFNPVIDFLEALPEWDGKSRVDYLFIDYLDADDNVYVREAARLFLMGAVTRAYEPGHKFDFVPILEGSQGKGKSTFVQTLAYNKAWFATLSPAFDKAKEQVESMLGKWLLEVPELAGFSKHDVQSIKRAISTDTDTTRLSYDKRPDDYRRSCVFIGTTNDAEYLNDNTGNRRYWPVKCRSKSIDIRKLRRNIEQLWAEALYLYRQMREEIPQPETLPLYLSDEATKIAMTEQAARQMAGSADILASKIKEWADEALNRDFGDPIYRNAIDKRMIFEGAMEGKFDRLTAVHARQIDEAMALLPEWEKPAYPFKYRDENGKQKTMRGWRYVGVRKKPLI